MTFLAQRKAAFKAEVLSTDRYAEQVEFAPKVGQARTITVKIERDQQTEFDELGNEKTRDRILVSVFRDPTDATVGGIGDPRVGDMILRGVDRDPERRPFTYHGEIENETPYSWKLVYGRTRQRSQAAQG